MNRRESFEGWNGVVEDMIRRGTKATDEEFGEVVDYLVAHFPKTAPIAKVNVNKADAKELVSSLGITDDHARKIVQHREAKGTFKSIEDLQKVPDIDIAAIEAKKNKLEF
jgi:competence protein ComEA